MFFGPLVLLCRIASITAAINIINIPRYSTLFTVKSLKNAVIVIIKPSPKPSHPTTNSSKFVRIRTAPLAFKAYASCRNRNFTFLCLHRQSFLAIHTAILTWSVEGFRSFRQLGRGFGCNGATDHVKAHVIQPRSRSVSITTSYFPLMYKLYGWAFGSGPFCWCIGHRI